MELAVLNLDKVNDLTEEQAKEEFMRCCGSARWAGKMAAGRPYMGEDELFHYSDKIWFDLGKEDWLEAFSHHPKIGDIESLSKKFADTKQWAEGEQSGVNAASREILQELADGNQAYEDKFGYIFIVCATGKTAGEMLEILKERLNNTPETEIKTAMKEQNKITHIRLEKLLNS
jgi:2-oxo-4-hydroxy-4-carboxy-5-ureidoimidazoline decarboxylase